MQKLCLSVIVSSTLLFNATVALSAEEPMAGEPAFDRSIASAAIERMRKKLDLKLRGSISHDQDAEMVTQEDLIRPTNPYERPEIKKPLPDRRKPVSGLVPMVNNNTTIVDMVVTGSTERSLLPPVMKWDRFDADGQRIDR